TEDDFFFFFASRRRHTRFSRDWSSDVCSSDLEAVTAGEELGLVAVLSDEADRFLGRTGPDVLELGGDHVLAPFVAVWMAVQTLIGLAGMGTSRTPRSESASTMALMTAGAAPMVPASPMPLTPSWLVGEGVTV